MTAFYHHVLKLKLQTAKIHHKQYPCMNTSIINPFELFYLVYIYQLHAAMHVLIYVQKRYFDS